MVHLRVFEFDDECPLEDVHQFILKVSDRVPHLEYFSMTYDHYKRVGGKFVTCDETERPRFEL